MRMSGRSKNSSANRKRGGDVALDRPFDPKVLKQARDLAVQYRIILEPDDDVGYMGNSVEMPNVWGDGKTPDACVRETREALVSVIATMLEKGEAPPLPTRDELRDQQINVRVTAREKLILEELSRSKGFRGISDFVRSTSLSSSR
jgi:predicted RNase H-like HicB family nuclease